MVWQPFLAGSTLHGGHGGHGARLLDVSLSSALFSVLLLPLAENISLSYEK